MADLSQVTTYTGKYSGLLNNLYVTITVAGVCLIGYEIEVHVPRRRGRDGTFKRIPVRVFLGVKRAWSSWRRGRRRSGETGERLSQEGFVGEKGRAEDDEARKRLGAREQWEFGYIYQPKAWRLIPGPPLPRWPLAWLWSTLKVRERDMPETCGLDITLHMRFLRGTFFYIVLQACTVLPILMPLHIFYSSDEISPTSMTRASVSTLVVTSGARWLWVHALLLWWVTLTWTATILWITWGGLAYRRREVKRLEKKVKASRADRQRVTGGETGVAEGDTAWSVGDDSEGIKRFRTLMVTNVPPDMRDEKTLQDYFDHYIHRHQVRTGQVTLQKSAPPADQTKGDTAFQRIAFSPRRILKKPGMSRHPATELATPLEEPKEMLGATRPSYDEEECEASTWESEVDEVILVRKLGSVASLRSRRTAVLRQLEIAHIKLAQRVLKAVAKNKSKFANSQTRIVIHPAHDVEKGVEGLNAARNESLPDLAPGEKMERLVQALGRFVDDEPEQLGRGDETVWDVLHALPRELLDPYQALTHLTSLFRDQNAPLIDYLTTKLSYLTLLLDEARSKPLSSYSASSTAFVTFRDARTARLALKILDSHPKRSLACHTMPAPDWTNLLWPRLGKSVYRSEFVRGWVVHLGVWAFTLAWIFPVSILCALASLDNIAGFVKPLQDFIAKYPDAASAITSLAPVVLVAGLTIAICPILLVIANKAETIYTRLGIHNSVLERFWKFLMVNGVVFFALGQSAIQAYLVAFQSNNFDPLPSIAAAFPKAAPYFASYILLQTAIQPCFELFRFGLPAIVYVFGTRVSVAPRQRSSRTEYPTFSHFSQVPQHLLGVAIMHLFMLLNPLVIPFCLVFYGTCYLVWKKQFTYVYGRLYENNGRRTSVRVVRYSLDALALAQFGLFAFFILNKAKGHAISTGFLFAFTLIGKLIITRALKRRFDLLDIRESELLCPPVIREHDNSSDSEEEWIHASDPPHTREASTVSSRIASFRRDVSTWAGRWGYAASHRTPPVGYRKPIPFDHMLFSILDSKIDFEEDNKSGLGTVVPSEQDVELRHEPDHAIEHALATKLVTPHHGVRPWEDIPPYQRSRGYNDQPDYTDDYDDFLWLPRDPLSTLDLDDTVEMRLALTTSEGGSGRIGDWPPAACAESEVEETVTDWQEVYRQRSQSPELGRYRSSDTTSEQGLIAPPLSPNIGSQVEEAFDVGLVRRGTKRMGEGLSTLFRKPRTATNRTNEALPMRTFASSLAAPGESSTPLMHPQAVTPERPSIQLVPQRDISQRIPTPMLTMRTGTSGSTQTPSSQAGDSVFFVSPHVATPEQERTRSDTVVEDLTLDPPPRVPRLTIQLGKSPSGRVPSRLRAGSRGSAASILSPTRQRSIALGRDRSTSVFSAQQEAWLKEVMEEERLASKDSKKEEMAEKAVDEEEFLKEERRLASLSRSGSKVESGVGRSRSRLDGVTRGKSRRFTSDSAQSGAAASDISGENLARPVWNKRGSRVSAQTSGSIVSNGSARGSRLSPPTESTLPPKTAPL